MMDLQSLLDEIRENLRDKENRGKVADYIPELAKADIRKFGIAIATTGGEVFGSGYRTIFDPEHLQDFHTDAGSGQTWRLALESRWPRTLGVRVQLNRSAGV